MSQIAELEQDRVNAEHAVARRDAILKLSENREFKKYIREEFMVQEAARMVQLSADPILDPAQRADALAMAQASGHLKRWMNVIIQQGNVGERQIEEIDAAIAELRAMGEE